MSLVGRELVTARDLRKVSGPLCAEFFGANASTACAQG